MKKLIKLGALTMTAGIFLAACGDTSDTEIEEPDTEMDTETETDMEDED